MRDDVSLLASCAKRRGSCGRRPLLLGAVGVLSAPAVASYPEGYRWRILRDGEVVGTHRVSFPSGDPAREARTEVEITVRLAGFTVHRYRHDYLESWDGSWLVGFRSRAERNGATSALLVRPEGEELLAEGGRVAHRLPRDAAPLSWWNPRTLHRPLFQTGNGRPLAARPIREDGRWRLPAVNGAEAAYDAAGQWVGYAARGEDGVAYRYEPG